MNLGTFGYSKTNLTYGYFKELIRFGELKYFRNYDHIVYHHWNWYLIDKPIENICNNSQWKRFPFMVWSPYKDQKYLDKHFYIILDFCITRDDERIYPETSEKFRTSVSLENILEVISLPARDEILFNLDLFI